MPVTGSGKLTLEVTVLGASLLLPRVGEFANTGAAEAPWVNEEPTAVDTISSGAGTISGPGMIITIVIDGSSSRNPPAYRPYSDEKWAAFNDATLLTGFWTFWIVNAPGDVNALTLGVTPSEAYLALSVPILFAAGDGKTQLKYETGLSTPENPIDENGVWLGGETDGGQWSGVEVDANHAIASRYVEDVAGVFRDPLAVIDPAVKAFGPDHWVAARVFRTPCYRSASLGSQP